MTSWRRDSHSGLTALEVLVATMLAAILMGALLGVLRGLKASEGALEIRSSGPAWQRQLHALLDADLANAQTYRATATEFSLTGFGGRSPDGRPTWLPGGAVYEVRATRHGAWLVRRATNPEAIEPSLGELTLAGVTEIRVGRTPTDAAADSIAASAPPVLQPGDGREEPVTDDLTIEFWGEAADEPLLRHRCRRP